jgi:hypothetical protein
MAAWQGTPDSIATPAITSFSNMNMGLGGSNSFKVCPRHFLLFALRLSGTKYKYFVWMSIRKIGLPVFAFE